MQSRVVGPVIIGAGVAVERSYVGPFTSVGQDCAIADSEIEYSIVLPRRVDPRGRADRGLADRPGRRGHASLRRVPRAHRLVLGDHSKVQIRS